MRVNVIELGADMKPTVPDKETIKALPLHNLATLISRDWEKPYFGAVPYINALHSLESIEDHYGLDPGNEIVTYFLANATSWRGEMARAIKAELKRRRKALVGY